jgi:2-polyprenyl-6-methoxyphenol hydroxylase-like FAD-dependent oxidoreductase
MAPLPLEVDVAIIGGGPGGLATALALTRAVKGTRVKVSAASSETSAKHYNNMDKRSSVIK